MGKHRLRGLQVRVKRSLRQQAKVDVEQRTPFTATKVNRAERTRMKVASEVRVEWQGEV